MKIAVALLLSIGAFAADPFYIGTWKIDSAVIAPWWTDPGTPDAAESKTLVGKTVTITATAIQGPGILACKGPHYKVVNVVPEGLYQGAFEELHQRDKSVDPAKLASKLGFKGTSSKSLQTGCANELDFHFVDPNTATFGLNDYVYFLKKQ